MISARHGPEIQTIEYSHGREPLPLLIFRFRGNYEAQFFFAVRQFSFGNGSTRRIRRRHPVASRRLETRWPV